LTGELEKRINDYLLDICLDDMLSLPEGMLKVFEEMWNDFPDMDDDKYDGMRGLDIFFETLAGWFDKWRGKK